MKPASEPLVQAPAMRESSLPNQSTPPGPGAVYGPLLHAAVVTVNEEMEVTASGQECTRRVVPPLWLPKNMLAPAPWVRRSEPLAVVDHRYPNDPAEANVASGSLNTKARCQLPAALNELNVR